MKDACSISLTRWGVSPLLLHLVLSETFLGGGVPIGRCIGIEHPDVQKGPLKSPSPESVDGNIQSGPVGGNGGTSRQLLSGQLL